MGIVMGIDHGNGHVKARSSYRSINLPAVYARPFEEGASYAAGELDESNTYTFDLKGQGSFIWGRDIARQASRTIASFGNRYNSEEFRLLSEFAMALLLPQNKMTTFDDVTVVTGYPSHEKGTKQEEELVQAFLGGHNVTINGKDKMVYVSKVYALPQPLGTVMSLYLSDDGYVSDATYESTYCGIIDIGSGTTDLDGVNRLKRQNEDIATFREGMFDVYKHIADEVTRRSNTRADATPQRVEQQILAGATSYTHSERLVVPMDDIIEETFADFTKRLINQVDQRWKDSAKFDRLILTGGGAASKHVAEAFRRWDSDIIVIKNAQEANANGFYRYGKFKTLDEE